MPPELFAILDPIARFVLKALVLLVDGLALLGVILAYEIARVLVIDFAKGFARAWRNYRDS